ncbi:DUF3800 domain-containing protein [Xanthomonas translucens pv. graminis]|uniref:DUF3800 domain-containing protein n=1 Tax=Xanthomonas graminis TaxID=3390026 RepID=UPI00253FD84D|nr:DUF3800 domain-containing protein [Xanthomonas translucens]WIH05132.1 DUF3800 domain-containing protein [Xanthomonas translucens pv. graminis]
MHVYCDESGNTGTNLLDPNQPVFALASTTLDFAAAKSLVDPLLIRGQKEAKYAKVKSSAQGRSALINLFKSSLLTPAVATILMADKRFYLAVQLVDKLIEPPMHEAGIDLYARDGAVNLANLWHYAGNDIFRNGGWEQLLLAFKDALQLRTQEAFDRFDRMVIAAAHDVAPEMKHLVVALLQAQGRLPQFLGIFPQAAFDPAVDVFIMIISMHMETEQGWFDVTHDASKPLVQQADLLMALMTPNADPTVLGYGDRKMELPLRVSSLSFGNSVDLPQLQLADLLAGCAVDCLLAISGKREMLPFHREVLSTPFNDLFAGGILPSRVIEPTAPPAAGERSLVDGAKQFLKGAGYFSSK